MATLQMAAVLVLILVLFGLFIREVLPLPLTALIGATLLVASRIITLEEGLAGFSNPATIAVLGMFVLSAGVRHTGAISVVTEWMISWAGRSHRRQLLALGAASGPISGFVNNTPVVAVMIPAAMEMARRFNRSPSQLLMPVSHIAMVGGLLTVVGTSTNLVGSATMARLGLEPFGFFEFTLVGLIALAVAFGYYMTLGVRLLPDRGDRSAVERFDLEGLIGEFTVPEGSPLGGADLKDAGLELQAGIQVLRITRTGIHIHAPEHAFVLRPGDKLLIEASRATLADLSERPGLDALPEMKHGLDMHDGLATAEIVITLGSRFAGRTVAEIDFRRRYQVLVLAIRHHGRVDVGPISRARLRAGDVLLVEGAPRDVERLRETGDFFVTRERVREVHRRDRMAHAIAIVVGVVVTSALGWLDVSVAALMGGILMVLMGCLRKEEFLASINWDIVILLAAMIPVGIAFEKTGGAELLADGISAAGAGAGAWGFLVLIFAATSLITAVASNTASVVLLIPVAITSAASLDLDPRAAALAVTMAASTDMMTPIGYQTNTMVYGPGNYRFSDYLRVGGPLNLLLVLALPTAIWLLF